MLEILRAHGLDAGPTQRPLLAGALSGLLADIPVLPLLALFGSLDALGLAAHVSAVTAGRGFGSAMLLGGLLYGALFRRAANDRRGGWLFGISFGFVLWMLGPVPLLQWLPERPVMIGNAAAGLFLGELLWGLGLGIVFPFVHRRLHVRLDDAPDPRPHGTGPDAAANLRLLRQP